MAIYINDVSKYFKKQLVLSHVSCEIPDGKIVGLLGPSGAGKTTLIRAIIGAINTDEGSIYFDDVKVPNLELLKHIGFMPQNDALYDDLSGEDNLRFFAELQGIKGEEKEKRINQLLELVELSQDRKKHVEFYSGGMKKRLSLAIALVNRPETLILDEPTVGIDPVLKRQLWNEFKSMKDTTIVVSTHVMDEIYECDKAMLLYQGALIKYDDVDKLLSETKSGKIEELFFQAAANV